MTAISYATAIDPRRLPFKDRRTSLKVAGVLLVIFGALSGCLGGLTPVGMYVAARVATQSSAAAAGSGAVRAAEPALDFRTTTLASGTYLLAAAATIWPGVGSLRIRRWVRPVILVIGWTWLVGGAASFAHWLIFGASVRELMTASWQPGMASPPRAVFTAISAALGVVTFVFLVALPAVLVWTYQRRGVRETLAYFDDHPSRWTDRCPTPVLAVAGWLALAGVSALAYSTYGVFPLFGRFVTGAAGAAALLGLAGLFFGLAWGVYRLSAAAWWGTAFAWTLWTGSMVWTFTRAGYHEFYRQAGYSPQQIDALMKYGGQFEDSTVWMIALWGVGVIGYLLVVRKYFTSAPAPTASRAEPSEAA